MNWNQLAKLQSWTPLKKVCDDPIEIGEDLYQIGDDQFVIALPHNREFVEGLSEAPFVTVVYWAPDVEAAKKCALRQENKYVSNGRTLPTELLHNTNGTYEQICENTGVHSLGNTAAERAVYSGKTGEFVHKVVAAGPITYCFLEREIQPDERPYAIEILLK